MSGAAPARPLSGGLWTLLAWLRRDDAGSSDSLSSAGSDLTVASFSFLAPDRCRLRPAPLRLPPPEPPTDSYKKRVRDRNARLQYDRDITLHRKYGLFRGENSGYDAFSLPFAWKVTNENRERLERERRAASECLQRRAAHVPGKRRAPPPPAPAAARARAATLGARRPRKRPAPPPPTRLLREINLNTTIPEETLSQMSAKLDHDDPPSPKNDSPDCKPEKHVKKEIKVSKRSEKSFLKQIFETRKRNSVVETIPDRILPSISELDKQAAEIIESCKLKALTRDDERSLRESPTRSRGDKWFCTRCLRKYDDSVVTCIHCVTEQKMKLNKTSNVSDRTPAGSVSKYSPRMGSCAASTSGLTEAEEKQKLKEMLKEIKDSLPKRAKHDVKSNSNLINSPTTTDSQKNPVTDAATLRIGSKVCEEEKKPFMASIAHKDIHDKISTKDDVIRVLQDSTSVTEVAVVTQPIVLQHSPARDIVKLDKFKIQTSLSKAADKEHKMAHASIKHENPNVSNVPINTNGFNKELPSSSSNNLNTPLKISSLFNSNPPTENQMRKSIFLSQTNQQSDLTNRNDPNVPRTQSSPQTKPSNDNPKPKLSFTSILAGAATNPQQRLYPAAAAAATKVAPNDTSLPQEQALPKVQCSVKTTSTTQTSPEALLESSLKSKPNSNLLPGSNKLNSKIGLLETASQKKSDSPVKSTTAALSSSGTSSSGAPMIISSQSSNIILNTKERNAVTTENLKLETKEDNKDRPQAIDCKISNGLLGSEVRQASLDHQNPIQSNSGTKIAAPDQHSRRRDLINQLEQSIAKGDERAAAEAAAKLAQLRLSCSVLSFSSQIVGAPSTSFSGKEKKETQPVSTSNRINQVIANTPIYTKVETRVIDKLQSAPAKAVPATTSKISNEKLPPAQFKSANSEIQKLTANDGRPRLNEPSTSKQCSEVRTENDMVSIDVWIEDKEAARGPIRMNMPRASVMGELRRQADASLGLAARLQRWIVGRTLCTDDSTPLQTLAGPGFDAPFYLCLVEPESNKNSSTRVEVSSASASPKKENLNQTSDNNVTDVYSELVLLERRALVPNAEEFECGVCMERYTAGQGAVLRECVHTFCRDCLSDVVKHSEEPAVSCPAMGCLGNLQEREIRALVSPEEYERWLARGLAAAESGTRNAFHCRTRDCPGWALCEAGVARFPCPVCKRTNCVSCQAIHEGDTCEQYCAKQAAQASNQAPDQTDEGTRAFLDTLISRGEALECPECSAIITKKWGCDWIKCSACKTEICWVTRGRRWGPGGRGDTSAGCRCGVDGKRCHPSCGYCH